MVFIELMLIKVSWETNLAWYLTYRVPNLLSKEGYFLGHPGTLKYFGNLKKRGMQPILQVLKAKTSGKFLVWLPSFERLLKV